jgi:ABC-type polysaccharide/polyol phosphate transport system ATPase subunit
LSATAPQVPSERAERLAAAPAAVRVEELTKVFRLPHRIYSTFKERALHPFQARTFTELRAVDDVSFQVATGEFFGIVGRNGSGKSTLLKCLAGVYVPDAGDLELDGRVSPFIELGVGFNPDLTARDNVIINAIMLGLTRRQARERFDDVIAFAELEQFLDLKLKNYSSGMSVRLAFSVAIQVDADVLLVDEVLAVGDAGFQQKCFEQFQRLKDAGKTIIFVTHDMAAVERFCDRAMLIERGKILSIDSPHAIARAYNELNFGRLTYTKDGDEERYGAREAVEIRAAWFEGADGERIHAAAQGEPLRLCMELAFDAPLQDPDFVFHLRNEVRHTVFSTSTAHDDRRTGRFDAGDRVTVTVTVDNWFAPGRYDLTPAVVRAGGGADALDVREDLASLMIHATRHTGGVIDLPHTWEVEQR